MPYVLLLRASYHRWVALLLVALVFSNSSSHCVGEHLSFTEEQYSAQAMQRVAASRAVERKALVTPSQTGGVASQLAWPNSTKSAMLQVPDSPSTCAMMVFRHLVSSSLQDYLCGRYYRLRVLSYEVYGRALAPPLSC